MQFTGRRRKLNANSHPELYGHALQFYGQPPLENISLIEFETFAVDRLKCERLRHRATLFKLKFQNLLKTLCNICTHCIQIHLKGTVYPQTYETHLRSMLLVVALSFIQPYLAIFSIQLKKKNC